jgi:hypothetical protein
MGGQFFAISHDQVWGSADGLSWTLLTGSPDFGFVYDVIAENDVLIAVGTDEDMEMGQVWTSPDGINWTSIGGPEGASELLAVAARGGDLVVIGDAGWEGHGRNVYFRSAQSAGWQSFQPFGEDVDGRLISVASNGRRFVATGYLDDPVSGRMRGFAVTTVDGTAWTRSMVSAVDPLVFDKVVDLRDGRFLAVGGSRVYSVGGRQIFLGEEAYAFTSTDGVSWEQGSLIYESYQEVAPEIGDMIERPWSIAAGPGGVVLIDLYEDRRVYFAPSGDF